MAKSETFLFIICALTSAYLKAGQADRNCSLNSLIINNFFTMGRNDVCIPCHHWYLSWDIKHWWFAPQQILASSFPVDRERRNFVRQVKNALFSVVYPTGLKKNPTLAAVSEIALTDILDFDPEICNSREFMNFVSGLDVKPHVEPLAHRYGGHQFGHWSGQLGDGRAVMLGEFVNHLGDRWELQLKGSGLTPYSRQGDGKAVIRSSVREFLCSEAMHALGIPTSRAASLVVSDDPVIRDQFYNGNIKTERAAIVLRLAQSWFRIGSLEILMKNNETDLLRFLCDFIITNYFSNITRNHPDRYLALFQTIVQQTAILIAFWQSVGFTHGVCNTDNFSILSITLDYGPFGFLENYNPSFVPNTSDDESRYSYENQPEVGRYNLDKLREAVLPLLTQAQKRQAKMILSGYADIYKSKFMELFLQKLGFANRTSYSEDDEQFVAILLKIMEDSKADFTMTFRELSEISLDYLIQQLQNETLPTELWTLTVLANHEWFVKWLEVYTKKLSEETISESERQRVMLKTNPRYILRNWIAQVAIEKTENNDFSEINSILKILQNPYTYSTEAETKGFALPPPKWSKFLKVSCSS